MRACFRSTLVAGLWVHVTASAQAPADFFGVYVGTIYVGVPDVAEPDSFPFTAAGQQAFNDYDVFTEAANQTDDCAAETMPEILWSGDPMEFIDQGERIVMRFERRNTVRTIHMDGSGRPADHPHTELGYSVGRWVGDTLTIETSHMPGGVIRSNRSYPISPEARVTERYWPDPGEATLLHMELLVDDPVNYTDTLTFGREWVRSPDDEIRPWECVSLGPRDSEPDIDELARMLEEL